MKIKFKISKLFIITLLLPVVIVSAVYFSKDNYKILETSLLSILQNIAEQNAPEPPDLSIENVSIKKISDPTDNFKYYKYSATIILHNSGGNLFNGRVLLHAGNNQKHVLVSNTDDGFTLMSNQNYIIRNFDFVFDARYNGGTFPITVEISDKQDYYPENNTYNVDIFEPDAKIKSISVDEILEDGTVVLDFNSIPFSIRKHEFEIFTSNDASYSDDDLRYDEIYTLGSIYGYYKLNNSRRVIKSNFISKPSTELKSRFIELDKNPFLADDNTFVFIKATNPETTYYAISDVILLPPQTSMTRSEFAKEFVEKAGLDIYDDGIPYFEDINENSDYYSYVQTLYNLGLLDTTSTYFKPDAKITRAEVLRVVMDYYDADLHISPGAPHFEDVDEKNYIFPYVESLASDSGQSVFKDYFKPDFPASKSYLNYLVYEYGKSN